MDNNGNLHHKTRVAECLKLLPRILRGSRRGSRSALTRTGFLKFSNVKKKLL